VIHAGDIKDAVEMVALHPELELAGLVAGVRADLEVGDDDDLRPKRSGSSSSSILGDGRGDPEAGEYRTKNATLVQARMVGHIQTFPGVPSQDASYKQ